MTAARLLQLDGELTIYRATELKPRLLALLDGATPGDGATVDLSEVTEIDTAGVQLLLLARREAAACAVSLSLVAPSPAVRDAFALLELGGHLGAPVESARADAAAA